MEQVQIAAKGRPDQVVFDLYAQFKQARTVHPEYAASLTALRDETSREVRDLQVGRPHRQVEVVLTIDLPTPVKDAAGRLQHEARKGSPYKIEQVGSTPARIA